MNGSSVFEEKSSFKMQELSFSSTLDWDSCIGSMAKTGSKQIGALIFSVKFFASKAVLYHNKSIIRPCMKQCQHFWVVAGSCSLDVLDKLQNIYVGLLVLHLLPPINLWLIVEMWPIYVFSLGIPLVDVTSELAKLVPLPYSCWRCIYCPYRLNDFFVAFPRCYKVV